MEITTGPRSLPTKNHTHKKTIGFKKGPTAHWQKTRKRQFLLLCTARYHTQAAAARPISPCGGDLSGRCYTGVGVGRPAAARRPPPAGRRPSLAHSRGRVVSVRRLSSWCRSRCRSRCSGRRVFAAAIQGGRRRRARRALFPHRKRGAVAEATCCLIAAARRGQLRLTHSDIG